MGKNESYEVPFNREIGRLFLDKNISAFSLVNSTYDLINKKIIEKPFVVELYEKHKEISVLNIGCGGCADIPLLEEIIIKTLKNNGISNPKIKILNIDHDKDLVLRVKNAEFNYFRYFDIMEGQRNVLSNSTKLIDDYINKSFYENGEKEVDISHVVGFFNKNLKSFLMKKEVAQRINIEEGNALSLNYPSHSFNIILIHYLLQYLNEEQKLSCVNEVRRVTKRNGIIFPNYGVYRKGYFGINHRVSDKERLVLEDSRNKSSKFELEGSEKDRDFGRIKIHYDNIMEYQTLNKIFNLIERLTLDYERLD